MRLTLDPCHYFPTKRDYYVACVQAAGRRIDPAHHRARPHPTPAEDRALSWSAVPADRRTSSSADLAEHCLNALDSLLATA